MTENIEENKINKDNIINERDINIKRIDLSVFMPAIRVPNWLKMYESLLASCKKYSFELVLVGPFDLPEELKQYENIKIYKDFGSPSRCAQLASFKCDGKLIYHCVDDAIFLEDSIDLAMDFYYNNCFKKDVINMRFREGPNYSGQSMPKEYWNAWHHESLRLAGIPNHFKISLHHLMNTEYFKDIGGYDCAFEYQNFNLHDLMFRIQNDGGRIYDSPTDVTTCDHGQLDHKEIEMAYHESDFPLFRKLYSDPNILISRAKIDLNNWLQQSPLWHRRFDKIIQMIPKNYNDLINLNAEIKK